MINKLNKFVEKAKKCHNGMYDYSRVNYISSQDKVEIICKEHGSFHQRPAKHLQGNGCPLCKNNKISQSMKLFHSVIKIDNDFDVFINSISPNWIKNNNMYFIKDKKFKIIYNNLPESTDDIMEKSHFRNILLKDLKDEITTFQIYSDEWINKKEIVKSMIKYRTKLLDEKIYARKCELRAVDKKEGADFFNKNHISGNVPAFLYFGLYYNNKLVCCLSFRHPVQKKYENAIEIARFANNINMSVTGGFQKLYNHAKMYFKQKSYNYILTYSDLRFGQGNVYRDSGFEYLGMTPVDYYYTDGVKREFRFKYRADKQNGLTEKEVAEKNKVKKIFGCGHNIWIYNLSS